MRRAVGRKGPKNAKRLVRKAPRNRQKPNYGFLFSTFLLSAAISFGISFTLQTPYLVVKQVKIEGVKLGDKESVANAARYALGRNILLVRKTQALNQISKISEVAEVTMGRSLPDKMWVKVRERTPYAVVTNGSEFFMMQSDGLVFHRVSGPVKGLPLISVGKSVCFETGKYAGSPSVRYGLEALKSARRERLAVGKISIDHDGNMCLNMDSNFCVMLGQPGEFAEKMSVVRSVLDYHPSIASEAAYIEVSHPAAPAWKRKQSVQAVL